LRLLHFVSRLFIAGGVNESGLLEGGRSRLTAKARLRDAVWSKTPTFKQVRLTGFGVPIEEAQNGNPRVRLLKPELLLRDTQQRSIIAKDPDEIGSAN